MKKSLYTLSILTLGVSSLGANPMSEEIKDLAEHPITITTTPFIKEVSGYIRAGYQSDHEEASDLALGGKLHLQTNAFYGISAGFSLYGTERIGSSEGAGVPFFDANGDSYAIIGEAYLKGSWGDSTLKVGRQEIDTPFLDTDDIGMIPNTFEALYFVDESIDDLTLTMAYVTRMAGVDAEHDPKQFEKIRNNEQVQFLGLEYAITEDLSASAWYYHLDNLEIDYLLYSDLTYTKNIAPWSYTLGVQYAKRSLKDSVEQSANVWGVMGAIAHEPSQLELTVAYNEARDNHATNGFGGGPFYTSSEHLTLREANVDGEAYHIHASWSAKAMGYEELTLSSSYLTLNDQHDIRANEFDLGINYSVDNRWSVDLIYSDIDDDINQDRFQNTRIFINYAL
jgi:imipenem/basic amino acid-specific outer membrane pore